ncbi:type VI secretion system baseplate subunit TssF [Janthinobacterium sp. EB271-G4-7A]|uniref:type VI secretion system baseplate subunit TssF n=1 Tax=Janthinobacterium sp. EB271-G4-7A TaxID=2775056 RepID=UPI001E648BD6|nr:type VI secretion system baseplate subunit TssF [Janthinobacterium sp. EB271-G4-7A]MCC7697900.1 type VI secretion system baseplate subunit TssF [Janthinobacterium sp. EB271-G4-7A]
MEELLPYYERELGFLRRYSREFSERYPKIAGRLLIGGEVCEDPHIERMIQSFALLNSRISKRLDDDYPEFTEALFEVLYPHYLRPFPSCSIARLDYSGAAAQLTAATEIARGTELATRPVKGVACTFRTAYPVTVAPLALTHAAFAAIIDAPEQVQLPPNATSSVSIVIEATADQISLAQLGVKKLRVFIDGEPSFCAALRDALFMRTLKAYVEADDSGRWSALAQIPVSAAGYAEDDALIPFSARSHPAYRLLTEYFCFPEKFNFFDIDLAALCAPLPSGCRRITLHLALAGLRTDSNTARMLGTMSTNNLLLGCTPVVNLFRLRGEPIRLTHTAASYPVLADARRAYAFEVQAIESVKLVRQTPQGESITEFRPFYSLRHGQMPARDGHYWVMRRDDTVSEKSPGYETEISIVDIDFDPAAIETDTLSLELSCTNRDLPAQLTYGLRGGDLFLEGGSSVRSIHFLRKPTESHRFERGRGAHWRLISHLSLNHLSLSGSGLEAFQEMLTLYDLPRSATSQRQISGIAAIDHKAANAWLPGNPFACLVRGLEVRLTLDEEAFVGSGIHAFAHIVECFLGLYVHANSFTQLVVLSKKSGEELLRCKPRSGDLSLV